MKIELSLKDVIIFVLIAILAVTMFVRLAKIDATLQTAALVKVVNDQGMAIKQIVTYLNGNAAGPSAPVKPPAQVQPAPVK